jgi:DNA-binding NarL/FixJ family response regulator
VSIQVLLADDHRIVREGLRSMLENREDIEVVGETENGEETVRLAQQLRPSVVVLDISMPDLNGVEATRRILGNSPGAKVIILSMHSDRRFVIESLRAGAVGYVPKDSAFGELERAIHTVVAGRTYLSPEVAGLVVEYSVRPAGDDPSSVFSVLTVREREVLQQLAEGKTTKEAAAALHVSDKTIETHRRNIMNKLDIHSIAGLTRYAIREGITLLN